MTIVTGYVRDRAGDLLADAAVRLYRRDTGALLGSAVSGDGSSEVPGDDDYDKDALLLHFDGSNNSTTITDSSSSPKTVTANGGAKISTSQSKFGGSSAAFDGDADYLTATVDISGTGDITIEFFARITAGGGSSYSRLFQFGSNTTGSVSVFTDSGGSPRKLYLSIWTPDQYYFSTSDVVQNDTWVHVAAVRADNVWSLYIQGTAESSTISNSMSVSQAGLSIGASNDGNQGFSGYIDEFRITKGVARYTSNFTPPITAFFDHADIPAKPLGVYSIDTTYSGEVQRIICAPDAWDPIANDLIDRIILP